MKFPISLAIVKPVWSKRRRDVIKIFLVLSCLIPFPVLSFLDLGLFLCSLIQVVYIIFVLVFMDLWVDRFELKGQAALNESSISFKVQGHEQEIEFAEIRQIEFKHSLGIGSRNGMTYRTYLTKIQFRDERETIELNLSHLEWREGKLIGRNPLNPKAFDLLLFLEKKKVRYEVLRP